MKYFYVYLNICAGSFTACQRPDIYIYIVVNSNNPVNWMTINIIYILDP